MSYSEMSSWIVILIVSAVAVAMGVWLWIDNDMPTVWNELLKANNR